MAASDAIDLNNVNLTINGVQILQDINLHIEAGHVVSVIGPSGCGKTTLLNIIAGLTSGWTGSTTVGDADVSGPGPDRTVVFQEDAVFPWMTVRSNVEYPLKLRGTARSRRRVIADEMLELVGLSAHGDAFPRRLSGGQRKRVDLARALTAAPKILLMDEPYAALDQMTKQRLQQEFLAAVARQHMTSLFVTHDLEEAIYVGDQVVVMEGSPGRIAEVIDVPFEHPRSPELRMAESFQEVRRSAARALVEQGVPA